ncbi:MAG: hypothetical protein NC434_08140 [Ruminococcus sp.]|nr:hypothetical protein [Ruminococcus sp.]
MWKWKKAWLMLKRAEFIWQRIRRKHICPTFLGICCFIWLAVIIMAVLMIRIVILWKRREQEELEQRA